MSGWRGMGGLLIARCFLGRDGHFVWPWHIRFGGDKVRDESEERPLRSIGQWSLSVFWDNSPMGCSVKSLSGG